MAYEKLGMIVTILGLWIGAAYSIVELPRYFPTPFNSHLLIVVTIVAAVGIGYVLLANPKEAKTPIQIEVKLPEAKPETARSVQLVLGGEELLKELERVVAGCVVLSADLSRSRQDVRAQIMELNDLCNTLEALNGEYTGRWPLTRKNKVTMVADQLREASSALSGRDIEHTKAHIDGAVQNAKSLITELKLPPSSYHR